MKFLFIIPLFKDWDSLEVLLPRIVHAAGNNWSSSKVIIVDDFSLQQPPAYLKNYSGYIEIVELNRNLGHQKAIAIGLAYAYDRYPDGDSFIVLDSDGEDKPEDIPLLIEKNKNLDCNITFAHRQKRNEAQLFRTGYFFYKQFFRLLTGQRISFGNFCILSNNAAARVIHVSEIWLHFSSGIIKSKIPFNIQPTIRGKRIAGNSKMKFTGLVNHGLSAIAVYSEIVAVRITLIAIILSLLSLVIIAILFFN